MSGQLHAPAIYTWEKSLRYPLGLKAGLDAVEKRKQESDTTGNRTQAVQPVARHYITRLQTPRITSGRRR
jgi:hypothetical protein